MPDAPAFDPSLPYDVVGDSGPPIAGFAVDRTGKGDRLLAAERLRQAWPGRQLSDAQLGLAPRRQAGLANAGLPDAPGSTPGKPANVFDQFDPADYAKYKARTRGMSDADVGLGGNQLPDAPWVGGNKPGMFDDLIPNAPSYGTGESAWEGYLKGASANWRDEIYGASKASGAPDWLGGFRAPIGAGRLAYEHLTGTRGPATEEYERARDEIRAREAAMSRQHPYAFGAGELGGAAASMLAVPGGSAATVPARLWNAAKTGAGYGALAGAGEGEGLEGTITEGARGALTGAALGTVGAGAVETLSPVVNRVGNVVRGLRDPDLEAQRRIAASVRADLQGAGLKISPQEAIEADIAGTPRALLDVGESTRALARSAANTSPEGRAALTEFTQDRFEQQSPRIATYIRDMTGGGNATEDLERIQDVARRSNRPAYRAAYAAGEDGLWTPELERLAGSPAVRRAMMNAVERGQDRSIGEGFGAFNPGVTFDNGIMQFGRGRGAPPYPNMQYWDYVQRELRDTQMAARRSGRNEEAGALGTLHRSLLNELDSANPTFARARQGAGQFFGAENALEAGQNFVRSSANIPEAQRAVARMAPAERQLFARGYASNLADAVERSGDNRNVLNAAFFNNGAARSRTLLALGPDHARRLEALLRAEKIVDLGRKAVSGNSSTVRQWVEMGLAGGAGAGALDLYEGAGFNPSHILSGAILLGAARRGAQMGAQAIDQRVARRVGELLTSPDLSAIHSGIQLVTRNPTLFNALRRVTGAVAGAGTEEGIDWLHQPQPRATGGGISDDFVADCQRAGLSFSSRASGGRAITRRVRGELTEANKASHREVGYLASSPRKHQRCGLCAKFFIAPDGRRGCTKVKSPVAPSGWCRRFTRDPEVIQAEAEKLKAK